MFVLRFIEQYISTGKEERKWRERETIIVKRKRKERSEEKERMINGELKKT